MYLFNTDNYYFASNSTAEWHKDAGEYGKNYPSDLQKFGDLKAQSRIETSSGAGEAELTWSLSEKERKMIEEYILKNKSLPDGYSLKTKVAEGKITSKPLTSGERENVEISGAKTYVVRDGFKAPDGVWNPETDIAKAFTNNSIFSLIHLSLRKLIKIKMVKLIWVKIFIALKRMVLSTIQKLMVSSQDLIKTVEH